jgi:hypothetical protein
MSAAEKAPASEGGRCKSSAAAPKGQEQATIESALLSPRFRLLFADKQATEYGEHHEDHDADNQAAEQQTDQFATAQSSHDIVPDYWMEPLAEIHCFSRD